jgi:hypothetical protein
MRLAVLGSGGIPRTPQCRFKQKRQPLAWKERAIHGSPGAKH